jgi:hypothetical protein
VLASQVFVFRPDGSLALSVTPYGNAYTGGVRFARADINGDGVPDVITVPEAGIEGRVRIWDGATGAMIADFAPFPGYTGGLYVAAGDVTGDGRVDIIIGSDQGDLPVVSVFDGKTLNLFAIFFAYPPGQLGGVRVAAGDVNGDGYADIVTAPGAGGPPVVNVFDGRSLAQGLGVQKIAMYLADVPQMTAGVNIAVGDIEGTGYADIITGPGSGPGHLRVVSGRALSTGQVVDVANAVVWATGGARVAVADVNGDGHLELLATSEGPNGGHVAMFGAEGAQWLNPLPGFTNSIYVG